MYQLPTPYSYQDIARTRFYRSRSNQGHTMTMHTYTPNQCHYQISTSYTLRFLRYSLDKIFKVKVPTARSKVKSSSHHDVAHLQPLTNVPTKYHLPTWMPRYSPDKIFELKVTAARSNQGHTMTLHTYTP